MLNVRGVRVHVRVRGIVCERRERGEIVVVACQHCNGAHDGLRVVATLIRGRQRVRLRRSYAREAFETYGQRTRGQKRAAQRRLAVRNQQDAPRRTHARARHQLVVRLVECRLHVGIVSDGRRGARHCAGRCHGQRVIASQMQVPHCRGSKCDNGNAHRVVVVVHECVDHVKHNVALLVVRVANRPRMIHHHHHIHCRQQRARHAGRRRAFTRCGTALAILIRVAITHIHRVVVVAYVGAAAVAVQFTFASQLEVRGRNAVQIQTARNAVLAWFRGDFRAAHVQLIVAVAAVNVAVHRRRSHHEFVRVVAADHVAVHGDAIHYHHVVLTLAQIHRRVVHGRHRGAVAKKTSSRRRDCRAPCHSRFHKLQCNHPHRCLPRRP